MEISLKDFKTQLSKEIVVSANKKKVRECDEVEKGKFVAYVDDGKESFDVALEIENQIVKNTSCDCKNGNIVCVHKLALMLHIAEQKNIPTKTARKVKTSKVDLLLNEIPHQDLIMWVKSLFEKNKDLSLLFENNFSVKNELTVEEIIKATNDAYKAVVKNKKTIDLTQLKKVIELFTNIHEPIVKNYCNNISDENYFNCFDAVIATCKTIDTGIYINSNRVSAYIKKLLSQTIEPLHNINDKDIWNRTMLFFINKIFGVKESPHALFYFANIQNLFTSSSIEIKKEIVHKLMLGVKNGVSRNFEIVYFISLLNMMEETALFPQYRSLFKPLYFQNDYNLKLISLLIENEELDLAAQYCKTQISNNVREEYSVGYVNFLKVIYTKQNKFANLALIMEQNIHVTFNFEEYLFIEKNMNEEKFVAFRTKVMGRAKTASNHGNEMALSFYFKLLAHEKRYKKMLDAIDVYCGFGLINLYFDELASQTKDGFLNALVKKDEGYLSSKKINQAEQFILFEEMYQKLLKHYEFIKLQVAFKSVKSVVTHYYSNSDNSLVIFVRNKLSALGK